MHSYLLVPKVADHICRVLCFNKECRSAMGLGRADTHWQQRDEFGYSQNHKNHGCQRQGFYRGGVSCYRHLNLCAHQLDQFQKAAK